MGCATLWLVAISRVLRLSDVVALGVVVVFVVCWLDTWEKRLEAAAIRIVLLRLECCCFAVLVDCCCYWGVLCAEAAEEQWNEC
jgi:hypothetical protein